jgi:TetR/AcrR family transcriptional repressor of nem operon
MGRPALVDRETALEGIMNRFWSTGYAATSLEDLLQASGRHRGSVYRAFGDKRGAFDAALERYVALIAAKDLAPHLAGSGSASSRLTRLLHARLDTLLGISSTATGMDGSACPGSDGSGGPGARPGCLVINTALELGPHEPATQAFVGDSLTAVRGVISTLVQRAVEDDEAPAHLDVGLASEHLFALLMGVTVLAAAGEKRQTLRGLLEQSVKATLRPIASERSTT